MVTNNINDMKPVYLFTQSMMNGTVTMNTEVAIFDNLELAEQTLADIKAHNAKCNFGGGMWINYSEIEVSYVYETKEEIPFYKNEED